jgi:hypothetical protein
MPNRYAIANGNWSNPAIWDGGTLPTSADVVRPNNFTVTIDQNINVQQLINDAAAPAVANGTFILTGNFTVTISVSISCLNTTVLTYNGSGTASIVGTSGSVPILPSPSVSGGVTTVVHNGTGTLNIDMLITSTVGVALNRWNVGITGSGSTTNFLKTIQRFLPTSNSETNGGAVFINGNGCTINTVAILGWNSNIQANNSGLINIAANNTVFNVNGNISTGATTGFNSSCIQIASGTNNQINVTGNVSGQSANGGNHATIYLASSGNTLVVNGNILTSAASSIRSDQNNQVQIIGTVANGTNQSNINMVLGNLNVTGAINGSSAISLASSSTGTITGNITGGTVASSAAISSTASPLNITGTITGGSANGAVGVAAGGTLNHIGTCQASAFGSAISSGAPTTSTIILTGPFLRNTFVNAIACQSFRINNAYNPYFEFRKSDNTDVTYVDQSTLNFPAITDVRSGTTYASGLYTGTAIIPSASNVSQDIPVDNTVGTAQVSGQDLLDFISTSSDPLAVRLRNVSTVATTGAQIASYTI